MTSLIFLVIGMGLVTYIPRMLPMVFLQKVQLPVRMRRFLEFVPYAVLASLIFPDILFSVENIESAIMGSLAALILAALKVNLILVVIGGITGVFIMDVILAS
ncbi:AzlD domain-containing protein [Bacillus sp. A116_S68]|nr:AzlD domain-containing protein [Bacillus sp. A116_S68]